MEFPKVRHTPKKKWVIPKNHIAYYLNKLKEEPHFLSVYFFFDFSFRIMPVNMCRTDLEAGQSFLAPAASCTRCQTPTAEISNLAHDQSSLLPQFEKTRPQPLSVHEIYILRCFLPSYRPTRRFAVQSSPYRASVPCRNGASCLFHLQLRCWFRHENAQIEAQMQTEESDKDARSYGRPSNEYSDVQERVHPIVPNNESTRNYAEVRAYKMSENTTADGKSQFEKLAAVQPVTKVCKYAYVSMYVLMRERFKSYADALSKQKKINNYAQ